MSYTSLEIYLWFIWINRQFYPHWLMNRKTYESKKLPTFLICTNHNILVLLCYNSERDSSPEKKASNQSIERLWIVEFEIGAANSIVLLPSIYFCLRTTKLIIWVVMKNEIFAWKSPKFIAAAKPGKSNANVYGTFGNTDEHIISCVIHWNTIMVLLSKTDRTDNSVLGNGWYEHIW